MSDAPFQQSSFSGTRTALMFQLAIQTTARASTGQSKICDAANPAWGTQPNSAPDRFVPRSTTVLPLASSSLLPDTCSAGAPAKPGLPTKMSVACEVAVAVLLSKARAV